MCKIGKNGGTVFRRFRQKLRLDRYENLDLSRPHTNLCTYQKSAS